MGMEAASLYNHISSKQAILSELLMRIAVEFTSAMKEIKASDLTSLRKLESLVSLHVEMTVKYTDSISLVPNEWVHLEEPSIKDFLKLRDSYEKDFLKIMKACMKEGTLKKMDIDLAGFSMLSTLRWLYSWYTKHPKYNVDQLKKDMIQSLIYGLKA